MNTAKSLASGARWLAVALVVSMLAAPAGAGSKRLFELTDPRGDDHGDGTIRYPVSSVYQPGDLDLIELRAKRRKGGTEFAAVFARNVKVAGPEAIDDLGTPLNRIARHEIYTLNIDLYIDTDRVPESGNLTGLPGRKIEIHPDHAWERAVFLTPRPDQAEYQLRTILAFHAKEELIEEDPLVDRTQIRALKQEIKGDVRDLVFFPDRIHVQGKTVRFFVPDEFLGGPASPDWSYVVAVSVPDLFEDIDLTRIYRGQRSKERLAIVPVVEGRSASRVGSERYNVELQPPLIDILVPSGRNQEDLLSDYDLKAGRPVVLPGVVPSEER